MKINKESKEYQEGYKDGIIYMGLQTAEHTKFLIKTFKFISDIGDKENEIQKMEEKESGRKN